jgi:hypothetical protein
MITDKTLCIVVSSNAEETKDNYCKNKQFQQNLSRAILTNLLNVENLKAMQRLCRCVADLSAAYTLSSPLMLYTAN